MISCPTLCSKKIEYPYLNIVLHEPEIPPNTGNIARLCAAAQLKLHLIEPLGFSLSDKYLKRSGLDYWEEVDLTVHNSFENFIKTLVAESQILCFSRYSSELYTSAKVGIGDYLLFGSETRGIPSAIKDKYPCFSIPMWGKVRSLNLATSVGIIAYGFLHSLERF